MLVIYYSFSSFNNPQVKNSFEVLDLTVEVRVFKHTVVVCGVENTQQERAIRLHGPSGCNQLSVLGPESSNTLLSDYLCFLRVSNLVCSCKMAEYSHDMKLALIIVEMNRFIHQWNWDSQIGTMILQWNKTKWFELGEDMRWREGAAGAGGGDVPCLFYRTFRRIRIRFVKFVLLFMIFPPLFWLC